MKRIILLALCLACIVGTASAYQLYLSCPDSVQVGIPLKCSIDSNLPAGTTFDVVFYHSMYTATPLDRKTVTIQEHAGDMTAPTIYLLFETKGLAGGQYKVEAEFDGSEGGKLSDDSDTWQIVELVDRSGDITITSPTSQPLSEALRIEGSIVKLGDQGVQLEVRGPEGRIFGPQYIGTKENQRDGSGVFTQKVTVTGPGVYDVYFADTEGFIGIKTFNVQAPATTAPTPVHTTAVITTRSPTTVPTPLPTTAKSPLSLLPVATALAVIGLLAVSMARRH
jgi:hypothetical protein